MPEWSDQQSLFGNKGLNYWHFRLKPLSVTSIGIAEWLMPSSHRAHKTSNKHRTISITNEAILSKHELKPALRSINITAHENN